MFFFSAPPGILIGHFTQLVWAQAWKIGCGRIVYKPKDKRRKEVLFICNYGLAGNFWASIRDLIPRGREISKRILKVIAVLQSGPM